MTQEEYDEQARWVKALIWCGVWLAVLILFCLTVPVGLMLEWYISR